jgi:3-oxoacyl-[acyl-carrier-protein] synthase II
MGTIGSFGVGKEALGRALAAGIPTTSAMPRCPEHRPQAAERAALVGPVDLSAWVKPAAARRMSGPSRLAVAATRMAVAEAGIAPGDPQWATGAVVMATSFGPADFTERLFRSIAFEGAETASPFLFTESVANAPAAQMAIDWQVQGPNLTITQREAGSLLAVGRAAAEVASGRATRALAGVVEEMTPLLHAMLDRFSALARATASGPEVARPFDRRRNGLLAGEGATVLVLERERDVLARGVTPLARVLGGASAFDPTASRVGWGRGGRALAETARAFLARVGLSPAQIDRVVSGASGACAGDRLEAEVLKAAFGDTAIPPILAPKSTTGEYGGGHLAAAVLAAAGGTFGPTAGFEEVDPALGLRPHGGGAVPPGRVLASSLAAGGAAAWLMLENA